jgi:uncharacterized protein YdhG (YjbR/CyaY superfamily)
VKSEPERVEAYLAALPAEARAALEALRATIRDAAPGAVEGIAYQMPAFYSGGKFLVSYAAFKKHLSFFPASGTVMERLGEDLRGYFSGKGTLQFTPDKPLPDELVRAIVAIRLEEIAAPPSRH